MFASQHIIPEDWSWIGCCR